MLKNRFFIVFALAFIACFFFSTQKSEAKGLIVYGTSDKMEKVADLPDGEDYQTTEGQNFDMGIKYSVFHIFWVPLWVTEEAKPCGYIDNDNYVELTDEDVKSITETNKIDMAGKIKASFWNSYGGKLILALILVVIAVGMLAKPKTA